MRSEHCLAFIEQHEPEIFGFYQLAERLCHDDPSSSFVKLRCLAERLVHSVCAHHKIRFPDSLLDGLTTLESRGLLPASIEAGLDRLRVLGNQAAHARSKSTPQKPQQPQSPSVVEALRTAHEAVSWLFQTRYAGSTRDVPSFKAPDSVETLRIYRDAILEHDPQAQYHVGLTLLRRAEKDRDEQLEKKGRAWLIGTGEAARWFELCVNEVPASRYQLGQMYLDGLWLKKDVERGLKLIGWAADGGDADGLHSMGLFHLEGLYQHEVDHARALECFEPAAKQDHPGALNALVKMHLEGLGVPVDPSKAFAFATKAAKAGYSLAQFNLGVMYLNGRAAPQDDDQAFFWFLRSAEAGCPDAQSALYDCLMEGRGAPRDTGKAMHWLRKACDQGHPIALFNMGLAHRQGRETPVDYRQALGCLEGCVKYCIKHDEHPDLRAAAEEERRKIVKLIRELIRQKILRKEPPSKESNDLMLISAQYDADCNPIPNFTEKFVEAFMDAGRGAPDDSSRLAARVRAMNDFLAPGLAGLVPRPKVSPVRVDSKVGRNDPCPCGSGLKRKRCHPKDS